MGTDADLFQLARQQHGVFTRAQARALGFTDRMLATRLADARLERAAHGVLRISSSIATWRQQVMTGVLACGEGTLASYRAAASLHGLSYSREVELTMPHARRTRVSGITVHRSDVPAVDRCAIDGIPATTPARTLGDLAAVLDRDQLEDAIDVGCRDGLVSVARLRWQAQRMDRHKGIGVFNELLARRAGPPPASVLERKLLRVLAAHQLPAPSRQMPFERGNGKRAYVDFYYAEHRLVIEVDGHRGHATRQQRAADNRRANDLVARHGLRLLRFTWEEVVDAPDAVAAAVVGTLLYRDGIEVSQV